MFIRHIINQQGGAFCYSPPTAARDGRLQLKPSAFKTEYNQVLGDDLHSVFVKHHISKDRT
jgi:hypothetical protein